jgi:hypothetical protein
MGKRERSALQSSPSSSRRGALSAKAESDLVAEYIACIPDPDDRRARGLAMSDWVQEAVSLWY